MSIEIFILVFVAAYVAFMTYRVLWLCSIVPKFQEHISRLEKRNSSILEALSAHEDRLCYLSDDAHRMQEQLNRVTDSAVDEVLPHIMPKFVRFVDEAVRTMIDASVRVHQSTSSDATTAAVVQAIDSEISSLTAAQYDDAREACETMSRLQDEALPCGRSDESTFVAVASSVVEVVASAVEAVVESVSSSSDSASSNYE